MTWKPFNIYSVIIFRWRSQAREESVIFLGMTDFLVQLLEIFQRRYLFPYNSVVQVNSDWQRCGVTSDDSGAPWQPR